MKLLIIRFSSIGDIVLTTPVMRCLHQQLPEVEIHFLTKQNYAQLLGGSPYITKIHSLTDTNFDSLVAELKQENFDQIIDLHNNLRTIRIKKALKKPSFAFNKLNVEKWLVTNLKINKLPATHIVDRYMETVAHLGVQNDGKGLDFFVAPHQQIVETDLPHSHLAGFVGLVIGAAHATKRLPTDKIMQLCQNINYPIILLGGPEDAATGHHLSQAFEGKVYNACGKFKIHESADIVQRAKLIITHDTGLMHIAAAFKKPIISIWGNTIPQFGMYPYYGMAMVAQQMFEVGKLNCRPCSKIGYDQCPKKHFKCMNNQPIDKIAQLAMQWLKPNA